MTLIRAIFNDIQNKSLVDTLAAANKEFAEVHRTFFSPTNLSPRSLQDYFLYLKQLELIFQIIVPYLTARLTESEKFTASLNNFISAAINRIKADLGYLVNVCPLIGKLESFLVAKARSHFETTYQKYFESFLPEPFDKLKLLGALLPILEDRLVRHPEHERYVTKLYINEKIINPKNPKEGLAFFTLPQGRDLIGLQYDIVNWLRNFVAFSQSQQDLVLYDVTLRNSRHYPPGEEPKEVKKSEVTLSLDVINCKTQLAQHVLQNYQMQLEQLAQIKLVEPMVLRNTQIPTTTAYVNFFQQNLRNPVMWAFGAGAATAAIIFWTPRKPS